MGRSLCTAILLAVVAGCASGSSSKAEPSGTTASQVQSSDEPTSAPTRSDACVRHPIARAQNSYYGLANPGGTSIDFWSAQMQMPVDSDDDTIEAVGVSLVKRGPGGTITLVSHEPGGAVVYRGVGDFDGDGRRDLLVDTFPEYNTYVLLGTLTSGTYEPAVVGLPVPHPRTSATEAVSAVSGFPGAVGDQNRDGADDIGVGASIYSGRQITANGGRSTPPGPFRTLSAPYAGLIELGGKGAPPSFVVADLSQGTVDVLDQHSDRLVLDGITSDQKEALARGNGVATGWLVHDHHIVEYGYSNRSGATGWRFDLDTACTQ